MGANRRRSRKPDPLAHPEAIKLVFARLREQLPNVVPSSQKHVIKLLNAVRHIERRSATDTRRGRPSRWRRQDLLNVARHLRGILSRETNDRVSLNSFIGLYVRLLEFPDDILNPLIAGEITLFEASQLARLTNARLGLSSNEALGQRNELLKSHLLKQGSQSALKARIDKYLAREGPSEVSRESAVELVDDLIELDPYDSRHLFWEELRRIGVALRSATLDDVDNATLDEFLEITGRLSTVLDRIEKRRSRNGAPTRIVKFSAA